MTPDGTALSFATVYVPGDEARVGALADDIAQLDPDTRLLALCARAPGEAITGARPGPGVDVVSMADIGVDDARAAMLWLANDPSSLARALAPGLLAHALSRDSRADAAVFVAPDTVLLQRLPRMDPTRPTALLRMRAIPADDRTPGRNDLETLTTLDDGFLVVPRGASGAVGRLAAAMSRGPVAHQRWSREWDLLPATVDAITLDDPRLGAAYWNIAERPGTDFISLRLPGLDPANPHLLSAAQGPRPRVLLSEHPLVAEVVADRLERIDQSDDQVGFLGAVRLDQAVRNALAGAVGDNGDSSLLQSFLDDPTGEALATWLEQTVPGSHDPPVTRYMHGLWFSSEYAQWAFPNSLDDHAEAFTDWVRASADVLDIPMRFTPLPVPPDTVGGAPATDLLPGVNLVGFLNAGFGIGEATRLLRNALTDGGVPHSAISVSHRDLEDLVAGERGDDQLAYDTNLVCVNVDWLDLLRRRLGDGFLDERYSIGTWWWESNVLPEALAKRIDLLDEVWAGSTYVAEALSAYTQHPIRVFPLPIPVPAQTDPVERGPLGLPEGYLFMFSFDFNSTVERKNPEGVITAFMTAFDEADGPQLVVKTINGHRHLAELERLRALAGGREDILIYDGFLPPDERDAWARACDCYVSLHRCEGFGLTMAEAMAMGKPVIATGYSANLDFMDDDTAYLVPWTEWRLGAPAGPYPAGTMWADPDIAAASVIMRQLAANPDGGVATGARGRAHIAATRTQDRLAEFVTNRLEEIRVDGGGKSGQREKATMPLLLQDAVEYDAQRRTQRPGLFGRLVQKVLRPYSAGADEVDRRTLAAAAEAAERIRRLERRMDVTEGAVSRGSDALVRHEAQRTDNLIEAHRRLETAHHALVDRLYPDLYVHDRAGLRITRADGAVAMGFSASDDQVDDDRNYIDFEDVFRGDDDRVNAGLAPYVEMLRPHAPVLDIGCGRGEMLELLRDAGIEASGVDSDVGMVQEARRRGLTLHEGDAVAYLATLDDGAMGGLIACQVIEHIPWPALTTVLREAYRVLRPGGVFIMETVNPHCLQALKAFWLDPTHQHPIFPEACLVFARQAGFSRGEVVFAGTDAPLNDAMREATAYAVVATR